MEGEILLTRDGVSVKLPCLAMLFSKSLNCVRLTLYSFSMRGINVCGFQSNVRLKTALIKGITVVICPNGE